MTPPDPRNASDLTLADLLNVMAADQDEPYDVELLDEAARRLRRGGGAHISNAVAGGGDIIARATSERYGQ